MMLQRYKKTLEFANKSAKIFVLIRRKLYSADRSTSQSKCVVGTLKM